jgi:hypothetical protein
LDVVDSDSNFFGCSWSVIFCLVFFTKWKMIWKWKFICCNEIPWL